jgi:hypothetical protein
LPAGGALVVYEAIIDDDPQQNAFGLLLSLNMLIETRRFGLHGRGLPRWMKAAAFRDTRVAPGGSGLHVVGIK